MTDSLLEVDSGNLRPEGHLPVGAVDLSIYIGPGASERRVAGTVLMLIPVTVATTFLGKLTDVAEGASPAAAPVTAGGTLAIMISAGLRFRGAWRL